MGLWYFSRTSPPCGEATEDCTGRVDAGFALFLENQVDGKCTTLEFLLYTNTSTHVAVGHGPVRFSRLSMSATKTCDAIGLILHFQIGPFEDKKN